MKTADPLLAWLLAVFFAILLGIAVCGGLDGRRRSDALAWRYTDRYDPLLRRAAREHFPRRWNWLILKAMVAQESRFDPDARSHAGAFGLTQMMPATAREMGVAAHRLRRPEVAIDTGARYLSQLYAAWEELPDREAESTRSRFALASYNAGLARVRRAWREAGRPRRWQDLAPHLPAETQTYVQRIFAEHLVALEARHRLGGWRPAGP